MLKLFLASALFGILLAGGVQAEIRFVQNRGQWARGDYKVPLNGGELYFLNGGMVWVNRPSLHRLKDMAKKQSTFQTENIFLNLKNANPSPAREADAAFGTVYNYFQSGRPGNVRHFESQAFAEVLYKEVYPGMDLVWYEKDGTLEFDFKLEPGADPGWIGLEVQGAKILLKEGVPVIEGRLGSMRMGKPLAFQMAEGRQKIIPCRYEVKDGLIGFQLGRYDASLPLTIDPSLSFSTLSGSSADNWGTTATFDKFGNAYGGGMVFSSGFPTTPGVVDNSFNGISNPGEGLNVDLGIQKFSPDGRRLEYSTYIGGNFVDIPHSMVCDSLGNLIILGSTTSSNYPVTSGSFGGGPYVRPFDFPYLDYSRGADLFLTKLNPTGNQILASRFVGGNQTDGILDENATLLYNYGDQFRGEVNVDRFNNIYIASNTKSPSLATTGAYQNSSRGGYEAVIAKYNPNLSVRWLTYLGGSDDDAAYSVRCLASGKVVVCGGTASANFPTTSGAYQSLAFTPINNQLQNQVDGWISVLSADGSQLLHSTYLSSPWYDQTYLLEEKRGESFYVFGQTKGNLPRNAGTFGNVTGGMFVYKLDSTLSRIENGCRFGRRANSPEISPTAMTVDSCGQVYLAGWGAILGSTWPLTSLTTNNLPVTNDAQQRTTDGNDFYFMVLTSDFAAQKYGTFFGGRGADEHVDGGTSRFDKNGVIYQAVCADCGGLNVFPTTPSAFSRQNQSSNCNLGLIRFDFSPLSRPLELTVAPDSICPGQAVRISHNAALNAYYSMTVFPIDSSLDYANPIYYTPDGDSTSFSIRITGNGPGCSNRDTLEKTIRVLHKPSIHDTLVQFCPGDTINLKYPPKYRYSWRPAEGLTDDSSAHQIVSDGIEHSYRVIARNRQNSCADTADVALRNRSGSIELRHKNLTKPCVLERSILLSVDSQFRPNVWVVNGNVYSDLDSLRLTYPGDTLFASVRSNGNCRLFDSVTVLLPLRRPSFDTSYTELIRGNDCSRLARHLRANGRPDTAYWIMDDRITPGFDVEPGPDARTLILVQETAGCVDSAIIAVPRIGFMIPNILTLDGNGKNDRLKVENFDFEQFSVYNRWGGQVFSQKTAPDIKVKPTLEWVPAESLSAGTYFFNIKLRDAGSCKGWIELVKTK